MTTLVWDKTEDRVFESGIEKGVLYLPDGSVVPWNGLISITEHAGIESSPVYFDGRKIQDRIVLGDFSASIKAITFPEEFLIVEGYASIVDGALLTDQPLQTFGLCYQTRSGDDLSSDFSGHKTHVLYNLTAIAKDKTFDSMTDTIAPIEFEWDISAIPVELSDRRPTAHIVFDSRSINPELLEDIEDILYGTETTEPTLISLVDLVAMLSSWVDLSIVDHGDGSWTATSSSPHVISFDESDPTIFTITDVNGSFTDPETYEISDTP